MWKIPVKFGVAQIFGKPGHLTRMTRFYEKPHIKYTCILYDKNAISYTNIIIPSVLKK